MRELDEILLQVIFPFFPPDFVRPVVFEPLPDFGEVQACISSVQGPDQFFPV